MFNEVRDNFHYIVVIVLALIAYEFLRKQAGRGGQLNTG